MYIEESKARITKRDEKKYITFEVEDTGIGILRQEIPFLYELFGINKVNKEKKNVGLGLSISYQLSRKLGKCL